MKTKLQKIQYVYSLCHQRAKEGHLSVLRQGLEIAWLQMTRGIGYSIYHFAAMWHKDATWAYKTSFLSQKNYARKVHALNERKYHGITQYKPFEKAFFKLFNIPNGKYIGTLNPDWGLTESGESLKNAPDLKSLLARYLDKTICFKLFEGAGGKGFKAFKISEEQGEIVAARLPEGKVTSLDDLCHDLLEEDPEGWVLEEYIIQHETLRTINPSSVNTIRMYVFQDRQGRLDVLGAFLRIGRKGSMVDNTSAGGMRCKIDLETGRLETAMEKSPKLTRMPNHPDHGSIIEGVSIPFWKEAKTLGMNVLKVMPGTRFAGMDIAITPEGPVMVEVNIHPDIDGLCVMQIPIGQIFET